jgi:hypothetical protein
MTGPDPIFPLDGGCNCWQLRYRITTAPLILNCCHCRWCQRESGAAFALIAMIEADRVVEEGRRAMCGGSRATVRQQDLR